MGCGVCINVCPHHCLKNKVASFDALLAEAAFAVMALAKKSYFINEINNITKHCDCMASNGPIIAEDIGYLASGNIIDIEKRSVELINSKAKKDVFQKAHKVNPFGHILEMEKLMNKR